MNQTSILAVKSPNFSHMFQNKAVKSLVVAAVFPRKSSQRIGQVFTCLCLKYRGSSNILNDFRGSFIIAVHIIPRNKEGSLVLRKEGPA